MSEEQLKREVDNIISGGGDAEGAHSAEDHLHLEVIKEFCPAWVVDEIERLGEADFPRWCA
jgi:hypothetical protein